jgi:U3 small nucleolar RNA-associated protein 6
VAKAVIGWLRPVEKTKDLDPALQKAIAATIAKAELVLPEA